VGITQCIKKILTKFNEIFHQIDRKLTYDIDNVPTEFIINFISGAIAGYD